jgi:hypothetical protein
VQSYVRPRTMNDRVPGDMRKMPHLLYLSRSVSWDDGDVLFDGQEEVISGSSAAVGMMSTERQSRVLNERVVPVARPEEYIPME